jgi:general secretion pathway protein D
VLNFDNADIEVVIHAASEIVGFNYVLAPDVKGKVTVQTSGRIPQEEVFNVLLAILEVHGFTAVKTENLYKIVKVAAARERPIPTIVGKEPEPVRTGDEIITQIVPLRFVSAADAVNLLRSLAPSGNLIPHRETNLLVITDTAANIRRLLEILKLIDVEVTLDELQIIPLKFADAQELAGILNQLFGTGRFRPAAVPGLPTPPPVPGVPPAPRVPEAAPAERPPLIVPERRSNSLIVHARKQEMEMIRKLISQLDVDVAGGRQIFIYYAENGKAKDLTATMNAIYGRVDGVAPPAPRPPGAPAPPPTAAPPAPRPPGAESAEVVPGRGEVRFIADEPTNAVIVTTLPRFWLEIEETLKKLDRMPRQVLIEVLVAEITLTDDTKLGIEWAVREGRFDFSNSPSGTLAARPTFRIPSTAATAVTAGLNFFTFETGQFFTVLNALATDNKVNVLSSPSILTSENKKAVINVSDSIPIVTSQQVPSASGTIGGTAGAVITQTVEYKDAGIILTVTPRIGEKGTVALDIKQEVNDIGAEEGITKSRRIIKREAETSVVMVNNQSLVLGGLIKNKRTFDQKGIPLLSKIPLIGLLFGTTQEKIEKTELLILITPRVIGTALEAARLTEEMRKITPRIEESLKLAPRQPTPPPKTPPEK